MLKNRFMSNEKSQPYSDWLSLSDPGGILTPNRWSRNPVLYTVELRSQCAVIQLKYF